MAEGRGEMIKPLHSLPFHVRKQNLINSNVFQELGHVDESVLLLILLRRINPSVMCIRKLVFIAALECEQSSECAINLCGDRLKDCTLIFIRMHLSQMCVVIWVMHL